MATNLSLYPSKEWWKNKKPEPITSGADTELYSEVLAQICLAYSIVKRKAINWWDIAGAGENGEPQLDSSGRAIPKKGWYTSSMSRLIKLPPGKSLGNGSRS